MNRHIPAMLAIDAATGEVGASPVSRYRQTSKWGDREFLKKGEVFSDDLIDSYLDLKWEEQYAFEHTPHPIEFKMYYSF